MSVLFEKQKAGVVALVHNAALVNHALPYSALEQQNVQSVLCALRLALKLDAYLAFVSTAGTRSLLSSCLWLARCLCHSRTCC
jgi:thioester reductase-like protein